jgi:hypothetical protein
MAVRARCRLGGLRVGAERLDSGFERVPRNMSDATRRRFDTLLAVALADHQQEAAE